MLLLGLRALACSTPGPGAGEHADSEGMQDSGVGHSVSSTPGENEGGEDDDEDELESSEGSLDPGLCGEIQCDPGTPGSCGTDEKCQTWGCDENRRPDSAQCLPLEGRGQIDDPCAVEQVEASGVADDCADTLSCRRDRGPYGLLDTGRCVQHCEREPGSSGNCDALGLPGCHCFGSATGEFPVCLCTCDPLEDDCRNPEQTCQLWIDQFICGHPVPSDGDDGELAGVGEDCNHRGQCERGSVCSPAELDATCDHVDCGSVDTCGCCARVCDLRSEDPDSVCRDGQRCLQAVGNPHEKIEHVGVCVVPNNAQP